MRLLRYGVTLETLKSEHLEMVRLWRNQDYDRYQFVELKNRENTIFMLLIYSTFNI